MDPNGDHRPLVAWLRKLRSLVAAGVFALALFFGAVWIASEWGEVVTLRTHCGEGIRSTRLWVVDHDGAEWVRTGHPDKGWFREIGADPAVELDRAGIRSERTAVPVSDPALSQAVNHEFARKYGAADWIVALSGGPGHRVVVRLEPGVP